MLLIPFTVSLCFPISLSTFYVYSENSISKFADGDEPYGEDLEENDGEVDWNLLVDCIALLYGRGNQGTNMDILGLFTVVFESSMFSRCATNP